MAILQQDDFQLGTNGATISTANTAATTVTPGSGNTLTFDTAYAVTGLGAKATLGNTSSSILAFPITAQSVRTVARIEGFKFVAAASVRFMCWRNGTPGNGGHLRLNSAGTLELLSSAGSGIAASVSTTVLTGGTQYDIEFAITRGTTTSNGVLEYAIFARGGTTPLETNVKTGIDAGILDVVSLRMGASSVPGAAITYGFDNLQIQDRASGWIGPPAATPDTILVASPDYAMIDARGSTVPGGGAMSWAILPIDDVLEPVDGLFFPKRHATDDITYTVTTTAGAESSFETYLVPAITTAGTVAEYSIHTYLNGVEL